MSRPRSPRTCLLLVLLAALMGYSVPAAADEEGRGPPPAFAEVVAALPAPAAAAAFDVEGDVLVDGEVAGRWRLAASPHPRPSDPEGAVHWQLEARLAWTEEDARTSLDEKAWATGALVPVEGVLVRLDAWGDETTYRWTRVEEGYRVAVRGEGRAPMERTAPAEAPALTTLAAFVLLGRLAPRGVAPSEVRLWNPAWDYLQAERPFVGATIDVAAEAAWGERRARMVTVRGEDAVTRVALEAGSAALLSAQWARRGHPVLELRPRAADTGTLPPDVFTAPAASPVACALQVALAFATADAELFARVVHWPTLKANMRDRIQGDVTDEGFRTAILAQFEERKEEPQARGEAERFLRSIAGGIEVEADGPQGDGAAVTLPEAYGRMRLELGRVGGVWYLVRLPGA